MKNSKPREGLCCACFLPIELHFDSNNRKLGCHEISVASLRPLTPPEAIPPAEPPQRVPQVPARVLPFPRVVR